MWAAILAKLVAPLDAERAAKGLAPMLAMLGGYPDAAFTAESAREVCLTARVMPDGSLAPLNRVPTFGELELALGRWWRKQCELAALRALPVAREALPAPPPEERDPEVIQQVSELVAAFAAERSWNQPDQQGGDRPKISPRHLSDGQLLMIYEAAAKQGDRIAATRLAALRKKLATDRA